MIDQEEDCRVLRRADAREFIRRQGLPIAETALDNLASQGKGPRFHYGKGGSRYSEDDLLAFVETEKAKRARRGY
jgi:hypothetical protein